MTLFQAILLGIVQGITEFLPISSSGHLVIVPYLFGWQLLEQEIFVFDVLVQLGTLLAVILYYWSDLTGILRAWLQGIAKRTPFADEKARLGWYLIVATIPAGIVGLALKDQVEAAFSSITSTAVGMLLTAGLLLFAEWSNKHARPQSKIDWWDAIIIGVYQALAIFPGVSRSGSTITGGMLRDLDRQSAAKFSFLMAVPVMLAAGGIAVLDLIEVPDLASFLPNLIAGFAAAAVVGYAAIAWLLRFLSSHSVRNFAIYLLVVAVLLLGVQA
ncbi:MAG: undecaprenyl-diphosphatase UppP [Chloroflexota bacterium]